MNRDQIDGMVQTFTDAQELDAWLLAESRAARAALTEAILSLRAACETFPQHKDYVTGRLKAVAEASSK